MPEDIVLSAETLPEGFCPTTEQQRLNTFVANTTAALSGTIPQVVIGVNVPSVEDQDKVWIRLDDGGEIIGLYYYVDGEWTGARHPMRQGMIVPYYGSPTDVPLLDYGTEINPFWRVCDGTEGTPDLRTRTIIGQGDLVEHGVTVGLGDTGGLDKVALTGAESGKLHCKAITDDGDSGGGSFGSLTGLQIGGINVLPYATAINTTIETDVYPTDQTKHENMQPYMAMLWIIRTARNY